MASIGGITCTFVRGAAPQPKQRVALWHVPGIDGYGAQRQGLGDSEFRFVCVYYSTSSCCAIWAALVQALQGTLATVVNDWGSAYARCLILKMSPPHYTPAHHAGGCRAEILVEGVVA